MQINHLPAVKTRCCSAMPFFFRSVFFLFCFPSFYYIYFLNFTALNKHLNSIESVQIATWCCFNRNQRFFDMKCVCVRARARVCVSDPYWCACLCACVHKTNRLTDALCECVCVWECWRASVYVCIKFYKCMYM